MTILRPSSHHHDHFVSIIIIISHPSSSFHVCHLYFVSITMILLSQFCIHNHHYFITLCCVCTLNIYHFTFIIILHPSPSLFALSSHIIISHSSFHIHHFTFIISPYHYQANRFWPKFKNKEFAVKLKILIV